MMLDDPFYCKAGFYKDSRTHAIWIHKLYSAIKINFWSKMPIPNTATIYLRQGNGLNKAVTLSNHMTDTHQECKMSR